MNKLMTSLKHALLEMKMQFHNNILSYTYLISAGLFRVPICSFYTSTVYGSELLSGDLL